ncbi:MAG: hypothetical protein A7315_08955 [Candidatus Altiarchaeales archaeon WOR_SM1_79]|nr:MAG: hypothetical protein A7315_08955 [Candidatus Altiarchaeales archaeon WOR_SM1_79]
MGIIKSVYHIRQYVDEHPKTQVCWWNLVWEFTKDGKELSDKMLHDLNLKEGQMWYLSRKRFGKLMLNLNLSKKLDACITGHLIAKVNYRRLPGIVFLLLIVSFFIYYYFDFVGLGYFGILIPILHTLFITYLLFLFGLGDPFPVREYLPKPALDSMKKYINEIVNLYKSNDEDLVKFGLAYKLFLDAGGELANKMIKEKDPTSKSKAIALRNLLHDMETKLVLIDELDTGAERKKIVGEFLEEIKENLDNENWLNLDKVSKKIRKYYNEKIGKQLESSSKLYEEYLGKKIDIFKHETLKKRAIKKFVYGIVACVIGFVVIHTFIALGDNYDATQKTLLIILILFSIFLFCKIVLTEILELKEGNELLEILMKFLHR